MPPVGDQGTQGSCVAWSVGYAYKSYQEQVLRGWGDSTASHEFSPAYIYNQLDGGQDNGISIASAMNLLVSQGCDTLDDMPYNQNDYTTQPTVLQKARAAHFKEASWSSVPLDSQVYNIKYALTKGPVEAGAWVYWSNGWQQTGDINIADIAGLSLAGGHGICIVGYDNNHQMEDGTGALEFINSWGTSWGHSGYGWMSYTYAEKEIEEAETMVDATNNPPLDFCTASGQVGAGTDVGTLPPVTISFMRVTGSGYLPGPVACSTSGAWTQGDFEAGTTYQITPSSPGYTFTPASINLDFTGNATNLNFTCSAQKPTITVTSPASGATVTTGSNLNITWSYTGNPGQVNIELLKGGQANSPIATSVTVASGVYAWTIPTNLAAAANYQIQVSSTACTGASGQFAITTPAPAPTPVASGITIISPAGGATWKRGTIKALSWSVTGSPGTLTITLIQNGRLVQTLGYCVCSKSGVYSGLWLVSPWLAPGSGYAIKISGASSPAVSSTSKAFSIT